MYASQTRALYSLNLKLWVVVCHLTWELEIKLGSSARISDIFNTKTISPLLKFSILRYPNGVCKYGF